MAQTYQEFYPQEEWGHLAQTIDQHLSRHTPLWWVDWLNNTPQPPHSLTSVIGCLWLGNAIDQITGKRHTHIFLLYITPEHRRQGLGTLLMQQTETWARQRGDHQIGLQVFCDNQIALHLYQKLGYTPQSLRMVKSL